jgi:hypothetical protein
VEWEEREERAVPNNISNREITALVLTRGNMPYPKDIKALKSPGWSKTASRMIIIENRLISQITGISIYISYACSENPKTIA